MRVAFHTPLPPERSGIADYSFELLEILRHRLDVVAVVRDDLVGTDRAPEGVAVVGASTIDGERVDCDVYQMGNNPRYHRFLFQRALDHPGLLVLHDPSLADFHAEMCRSADSAVFRDEIAYDNPALGPGEELPLVDLGRGDRDLDRLEVLLARRIVEASVRTLVHSSAVAADMRTRYRGADVAAIQLPAPVLGGPVGGPRGAGAGAGESRLANRGRRRAAGEVTFGVFGGINYYKRIDAVVEAFRQVHGRHPLARLVVAGRPDDREMTARLRRVAAGDELGGRLEVLTELALGELEAEMVSCDVAISLRWPTAGEMSATLMRALGAGRPVVVTDVLQFRELDDRFCWRVPVGEGEVARLVEIMAAAAGDPDRCARAGRLARAFVEREATYEVVADQYVDHVAHCARHRSAKASAVAPLGLAANAVLGVNLVEAHPPGTDGNDVARQLASALASAGVDVVVPVTGVSGWAAVPERLPPVRVVTSRRALAMARRSASRGRRPPGDEAARRAPGARRGRVMKASTLQGRAASTSVVVGELHDVDVFVVDPRRAALLGDVVRERHRRGRRVVALLAADALPPARAFDRFLRHADEIWAPSRFVADVLAGVPHAPVVVVPVPLPAPRPAPPPSVRAGTGRPAPGPPKGPLRVLTVADAAGGLAGSNPAGAVAAFAAAFPAGTENARLEAAVRRAEVGSEGHQVLAETIARVGGSLVVDDDVESLRARVAACDVLVSLHRTTAFGLWCATAMAAGKPVVATAYGGLLDYATVDTACLVGYDLAVVSEGDHYLDGPGEWGVEVGQRWASPDVDQAAAWLRRLAAYPTLRARIGEAARRAATAHCDEGAVGRLLRARLEALVHAAPRDEARRRKQEARLLGRSAGGAVSAAGGRG